MAKRCEICGERPATVPDRERMGRLINRVCSSCHALRLAGDLKRIQELHEKRRQSRELETLVKTIADGCIDESRIAPTGRGIPPTAYSFATVNAYVHGPEVHYEDLQGLCLGMAAQIDRLHRGEFICQRCGLRKDSERSAKPDF